MDTYDEQFALRRTHFPTRFLRIRKHFFLFVSVPALIESEKAYIRFVTACFSHGTCRKVSVRLNRFDTGRLHRTVTVGTNGFASSAVASRI